MTSKTVLEMTPEPAVIRLVGKALRTRRSLSLKVSGTSMLPVIFPGEKVRIQFCEPGALQIGDVVLVDAGCKLLLHRIFRICRDGSGGIQGVSTRGDARLTGDPDAAPEKIMGKMTALEGGRARRFLWVLTDAFFRRVSIWILNPFTGPLGTCYRIFLRPLKAGKASS